MSGRSLPKGWTEGSIGELCVAKVPQGPPEEDIEYIDISSIDRTQKVIRETRTVSPDEAPTRARQWIEPGDVLVSMTRPNLNAVARVTEEHKGAVASTGFDVLRSSSIMPEWLFYRVRSTDFVLDVCQDLQGVVYPAIRPHDVRRHRLPVPPLGEQHRIVEAIESYFTRLDDAVATLGRVQRNLKRYRASVLKAAVEGRLVPTEAELARRQGRDYEPASVLLDRILAERRRRWE
ncbi:MAG: restriction endonuclease subunit S, partial [Planctomycetota bacterium]